MLPDPLTLKGWNLSANDGITALDNIESRAIDFSPGRTVRIGTNGVVTGVKGPLKLTISHQASKENGVVPTQRVLMRLEHASLRTDPAVAGTVKGYCQLIVGVPQGTFDTAGVAFNPMHLVGYLLGTILSQNGDDEVSGATLSRILAGEP